MGGDTPPASGAKQSFRIAAQFFGDGFITALPDGIVFTNDIEAQGVLMAFYRMGIVPGRDIRIASHTNAGSSALLAWHDQITRLEYDPAQLVALLFETLESLMSGEEPAWLAQGVRVPEWQFVMEPSLIPAPPD